MKTYCHKKGGILILLFLLFCFSTFSTFYLFFKLSFHILDYNELQFFCKKFKASEDLKEKWFVFLRLIQIQFFNYRFFVCNFIPTFISFKPRIGIIILVGYLKSKRPFKYVVRLIFAPPPPLPPPSVAWWEVWNWGGKIEKCAPYSPLLMAPLSALHYFFLKLICRAGEGHTI